MDIYLFFRKLYLRIRVFSNQKKLAINRFMTVFVASVLAYLFINSFLFSTVVVGIANANKFSHDYKGAISLYNFAGGYYKLNHFSDNNKDIYFSIPYNKAVCYWEEDNKQDSVKSMLEGITSIQTQYGIFSVETAYFIRKYLIDFYLFCGSERLAEQEFNNLLTIYKKVGYTTNDLADLVRLSGDLNYQRGHYAKAMDSYKRSYNALIKGDDVDYDVFVKVVKRISTYDAQNGKPEVAESILKSSIETLKNSGKAQRTLTAELYLYYGDLLASQGNFKSAETAYEGAIEIIKKLPESNYLKQNLTDIYLKLKNFYNETGAYNKAEDVDIQIARKRRFSIWF